MLSFASSAHVGTFIRCTAACSPPSWWGDALPRPLQVPWGPAPCLIGHSPALLPQCGCRACVVIAGNPLTPSHPERTQALYPAYCSVFSIRPLLGVLHKSPGAVVRTSVLVHQRCFPVVGARPAPTPPVDRALRCAYSAHGRFIRCTVAGTLPVWGGTPFNVLHKSTGGLLHTSFLIPRCYFLVMGAGPVPLPPVDRAPSAHGRFIQRTAAWSLLSPPFNVLLWHARSRRWDRVTSASPVPAGAPTLRDQTTPRSSGPLAPPGTDSTSRWSPRVGYFQGLIVGPSGATFSSVRHLGHAPPSDYSLFIPFSPRNGNC
ncbi:hypothetical protein NDU88_002891 [Pleurodeles waltl]|uniref:Uncharacterized protein n=1 Tax=Pleurodeles waltl TaxID=8319 RepID=A0AAV7LDR8_PLEWA|nr:hypothetical protein NDU88_002891 [Pleurodeles waltl]